MVLFIIFVNSFTEKVSATFSHADISPYSINHISSSQTKEGGSAAQDTRRLCSVGNRMSHHDRLLFRDGYANI